MATSEVPHWMGTGPEGYKGVFEDKPRRSDFLAGARAGGLMVGAVAAVAVLSRVQGGERGARRRRR